MIVGVGAQANLEPVLCSSSLIMHQILTKEIINVTVQVISEFGNVVKHGLLWLIYYAINEKAPRPALFG